MKHIARLSILGLLAASTLPQVAWAKAMAVQYACCEFSADQGMLGGSSYYPSGPVAIECRSNESYEQCCMNFARETNKDLRDQYHGVPPFDVISVQAQPLPPGQCSGEPQQVVD